MAFNEVCIQLQSARSLRDAATALTGIEYNLVQQTRVKETLKNSAALILDPGKSVTWPSIQSVSYTHLTLPTNREV